MITPEQRELRKNGLFSSDIARIMCGFGVSVALDKLGVLDTSEELEDLAEIRIGKLVEPLILSAYEERFGKVERSPDTIMHPEIPWMGVHLDGRRSAQKNVEAKTCGAYNIHLYGNPGTDEVPDYNLWQAHAGMACTDAMSVDIPVCFITLEATRYIILGEPPPIYTYTVQRDFELETAMIKKVRNVWDCIQRGETPEPENLNDIKLIYSRGEPGEEIEATELVISAWRDILKLKADEKDIGEKIKKAAFTIKNYMKKATELRSENQLLATWRNDSDGHSFDKDKFEQDHPDLYKEYLIPKAGARKLLPKELKKRKN